MSKELKTFDNPRNIKILLTAFFSLLAVLLVAGLFVDLHGDFPWEERFGFYCVYGFISCVALVFIAAGMRFIVKRGEDFYDR